MKGSLFSTYFLEEGIKNTEDWKNFPDSKLERKFNEIKNIYDNFLNRKNPDEADTEEDLIKPVLKILGFQFSRQKSLSRKGRTDVPDFILFCDKKAKDEFDVKDDNHKPWDKGICILESKRFNRSLDKRGSGSDLDPGTPSNQILRYLSLAEPRSNGKIVWGILTNGRIWRLYCNHAYSRVEGYVEFNFDDFFFPSLFKDKNLQKELFKTFYLLFRKEAFIPTSWRPHHTFLEIAINEGKRWEERVSEDLKDKIFYEVFPGIAKGLFLSAKRKGEKIDDELLSKIYDNTLILLYRLLFLLYAEDRDLLPAKKDRDPYYNYSLTKIRDDIENKMKKNVIFSEKTTDYWNKLKDTFKIVNEGDKSLCIPPYNGGLFNPTKHRFLEEHEIPDKFLVQAIDYLSRDYESDPPKRINYRDLSVRQLGSIYEGLLEFKLRIADRNLGVKREKGREVYYEIEDENSAKVKKGELYLTNDKSERKASGSYYTPDYIVQYIVKNTIEPVIERKVKDCKDTGKDPVEALLNLKILDPAMGSGHFLVGAVDYLSDRILEMMAENENTPLLEKLEKIRDEILKKGGEEGYKIDETKLEDKNLIKRIILKKCIYGVDLNPLAVELAKLSLWLHTFTVGVPLSFLDHHLKCGNSLIGADPDDFIKKMKGISNMFSLDFECILIPSLK